MAASLDDLKIDRSHHGRPALKRTLWVLVLLIVLGGGGAAAWQWWTASQVLAVDTAVVRQTVAGDGQPTVLNASGYVTARRQATVSSKVTGKVTEVLVEEGMVVRKGQVLARLDDTTERSYLALAEAQVQAARGALAELEVRHAEALLDLDRKEQLLKRGIIGQAEFDTAQSEADWLDARITNQREQVTVSEREIDVRRTALADTVIRAPFGGVAITKDAQPGEMISPVSAGGGFTRTGICTIVDMSSLEIEVDVNESYINRVSDGQRVVATLDAYPDWQIPASVITTIPAADRQRATVLVRIGFDELDTRILPDMGVGVAFLEAGRAEVQTAETSRLWVPLAAVQHDASQPFVFVLRGEEVERRAVGLGLEDGTDVEVTAGLAAGERLVLEAPPQLADGDRVAVG
jgi:RND family efflux transporter MFP subunit